MAHLGSRPLHLPGKSTVLSLKNMDTQLQNQRLLLIAQHPTPQKNHILSCLRNQYFISLLQKTLSPRLVRTRSFMAEYPIHRRSKEIITLKQNPCSLPLYLNIHQYIKTPLPLIICHHKYHPTLRQTSNTSWQIPTEQLQNQATPLLPSQQPNLHTVTNHQLRDTSLRLKMQMHCMTQNTVITEQNLSTTKLEISPQHTLLQVHITENQA